jgi:outer membrane PBP1 activator LpoA protein
MFQIRNSTSGTRISIPSLLAVIASALGGCAGIPIGTDSEPDRAVAGGYHSGETLAVLLPQSGRFADAARIVRDGIVAAQQADPQGARPTLRFYDSESGSAVTLAQRAAADGASLVIGPLQKPKVDELAKASALPIPVLALNQASGAAKPPPGLYQFSLSPEGEASEVAAKAGEAGFRRALVLYPEGPWGERITRAFRQSWKGSGGQVAGAQAYTPSASDYSESLTKLAERGSGADFLFLVATEEEARQIYPQIRGKMGKEIPVYSTSHAYGGRFDPQADRSLVGLNFVEIPWLVEPAWGDAVSSKGLYGKLPRLYAMGVDAYRLGSRLQWMSEHAEARISGKTGILGMDSRGRIYRQLTLARIEAAGPVKMALAEPEGPKTFVSAPSLDDIGGRWAGLESPRLAAIQH